MSLSPLIGQRAEWEELRELDNADITADWVPLGTPFLYPALQIKVTNVTNQGLYLTNDTTKIKWVFPTSGAFSLNDISSNGLLNQGLFLPKNTQIYVKAIGTLPTAGSVYLEVMHCFTGVQ